MKHLLIVLALSTATLHADDLESTVAALAKIGTSSQPVFSPDGKRIAFISSMSGSPQVWMVPRGGGFPEQITALEDPVTATLEWSPNGEWIALQVAPGGGLNEQVYVMRPDGTGMRRVTEGGKTNNRIGKWLPDSKAMLIGSSRRTPAAIDLWRVDLGTGEMKMVAQNEGVASLIEVSDDGKYALISRLASRGDNNIYRVAVDGSEEILLTPHTPPAIFNDAAFGKTPDTIYLAGNPDRDLSALLQVKVEERRPRLSVVSARPDAELGSILVNHRHTVAALNWNVGGRSVISMIDLGTGKESAAPQLAGDIVGLQRFSPDDTAMAVSVTGADRPTDIWIVDMGTKVATQLTRSPHPNVSLASLVRPELVEYTAHDGLKLSGWLYKPRTGSAPYATVFSFHGGPEGQERPGLNSTYQALLASGIAVFAPNVRGSSGFGKKFVNLDNGALRVNGVRDIKASVDALVAKGVADPKRLGIMGGSYGGYMVMAGVTEYPEMFAAGANLFGVVNFETFFKHTEPWMAAISTKEYGDPATEAEMLRTLSPIHKVDRVKTPLIVLHGANDTNVPVVEAEQVVDSLKKRGVPVEYVLFPDEGHGWRKTPNRLKSTVSIVKFFNAYLK